MADIDRQDRHCILIEDHPVAADAESVTVAALKGFHIALAGHRVTMKTSSNLFASVSRKGIEIFRGGYRENDRFHKR